MRKLSFKDNELYLDGEKLEFISSFSIDYIAGDSANPETCFLKVKGYVTDDMKIIKTATGDLAQYVIEEEVILEKGEPIYEYVRY